MHKLILDEKLLGVCSTPDFIHEAEEEEDKITAT
jgi:hypothetical protein